MSGLALAVLIWAAGGVVPTPDADVAKGVQQVEDGDYDGGILTLDNAVRRLSPDPARSADLAQAYVYLGVAYLGKGHEAAAKAKFREAVLRARDLSLSVEKFPPKVIDLFEEARAESSAAPTAAAPSPKKKGKTGLVLAGVGVAGAAGAALALGGGSDGGSTPGTTTGPVTESFSGLLTPENGFAEIPIGPAGAGAWQAQVSWTGAGVDIHMFVVVAATDEGMGDARLSAQNTLFLDWTGQAGVRYNVALFLQDGSPQTTYQLRVTHPR